MRIAFYAPLKPPDHPVPSGERQIARLMLRALEAAGHEAFLASRFRPLDKRGDPRRQQRLQALGGRLAERLEARLPAFDVWFTYHLYYKAPDWLGPRLAAARGAAYWVAEASHAPKRAGGPWDLGHRAAADAIGRADRLFCLNPNDRACLAQLARPERMTDLPPFLDAAVWRHASGRGDPPLLVTVAMMREGAKLASYRRLGAALAELDDLPWRLLVVGDGPARDEVRAALPAGRTCWLGRRGEAELPAILANADLFVWPAEREAIGLALLEAAAAGLPVVAARTGGVPAVVAHGETGLLAPPGDAGAFARCLRALLTDPARRRAMGAAARKRVLARHDIAHAAAVLG